MLTAPVGAGEIETDVIVNIIRTCKDLVSLHLSNVCLP